MGKFIARISLVILLLLAHYLAGPVAVNAQSCGAEGYFICDWTGIQCISNISSQTCAAGYGWDDSQCAPYGAGDCNAQVKCCVPAGPTIGPGTPTPSEYCYECVDVTTGCIPRSPSDPRCEYKASTQNGAISACNAACTGATPLRFACDSKTGDCDESNTGTFTDLAACRINCSVAKGPDKCNGNNGLVTAIGCIQVFSESGSFGPLATFLIRWGLGIGGGIAFVLIFYAGFMVMTSAGNPQRLTAGKELLTAAIMGVLMLAFAGFLLRFIGIDILKLNAVGFGK